MSQLKTLPWKRSFGSSIALPIGSGIEKYLALVNLSIVHGLKNYKSLIGLSLFKVTCLIIFSHLWKIAAAKAGATDLNPDLLLWYLAFNEWVLIAIPDIQLDMEQDLRSGRLAYLLPRPISYVGSVFAEGFGVLILNLTILGIVGFTFTWSQTGLIPHDAATFCMSIFLGFLAGTVALIYQILIGLSAFWLEDVAPFSWVWEKLLFILGGLILPLSVYPEWMQTIAYWTPFSFILGARSALAMDSGDSQILSIFFALFSWGILGIAGIIFFYRKGQRILNMEGG